MKSSYIDTKAIIQVIGSIYQNPELLDETQYKFNPEDFPQEFHRVMFEAIYNLHALGAKVITQNTIEDYLEQRDKKYGIYKANNGGEWLQKCTESISIATFDYYYKKMKKFTLLRMYDNLGVNVSYIYDPNNVLDIKKKQQQEDWLDNHSLEEIADIINDKIEDIKLKFADNATDDIMLASEGADELFDDLRTTPNVGYPMCGKYINKIFRGARFGCVFLRSAPTNFGKSRLMIADACNFACNRIYNIETKEWVENGSAEPTIYIATEQSRDEIQTMMWSFIAGVPEDHILENNYEQGEIERIKEAKRIIANSPLYIKELPDFSLQDIENTIKLGIRKYSIHYVCFDYIHSSIKILSEISGKANVKGLREDNVLFMMSVRLKDIAKQYQVFILTSTQLNGEYVESKIFDQNLLRGAKAIADKVDAGMILLPVTEQDRDSLKDFCDKNGFEIPTLKISIYKNRRGRYNHIFLWCKPDLGICRINVQFVTTYLYEPIEMEDLVINVKSDKNWRSAF
jgi:replicative DNA helicase